jgi:methylated-DNA-protein-cysteine methyltransferase-like protein
MTFKARVYAVVRMIPPGRVATYGQVAALAGRAGAARGVGTAMRLSAGAVDLPWHRVINAQGRISPGGDLFRPEHQRHLLEIEGVRFRRRGSLDLGTYQWDGPEAALAWE